MPQAPPPRAVVGLGFAVRNEQGRNPLPGSPNDYYWGGAWGTYFWHDPREHMYVVFMMQSQIAHQVAVGQARGLATAS